MRSISLQMKFRTLLAGGLIALLFSSCSLWERLQDSKVGRWVENLTAQYNIYFNAHEKWLQAHRKMEENYPYNYREVLPVVLIPDSTTAKSHQRTMAEVIKKTQKLIKKKSRSKWVDDAYVLMGIAYLYRADPYTALQMFQYVKNQYKGTPAAVEAHLWTVATYLQMGQVEKAAAYIDLLKEKKIPRPLRPFYWKLQAQIAIDQKQYGAALPWLKKALQSTMQRPERLRLLFVLGQLFQRTDQCAKAIGQFRNLIRRYPPYVLIFHSRMNILRCQAQKPSQIPAVEAALLKMTTDERNKAFLDRIYLELGLLAMQQRQYEKMRQYFALAARHGKRGNTRALAYYHIARNYYQRDSFEAAARYYDSAYQVMTPAFAHYEEVKKRRPVLSELSRYLNTIATQDSLLRLAGMPKEQLLAWIRTRIRQQHEARRRLEKQKRRQQQAEGFPPMMQRNRYLDRLRQQQQQQERGKWYFYNPLTRGVGFNDFSRQWPGVKDQDFWAIAALAQRQHTPQAEPGTATEADTAATDTTAAAPAKVLPQEYGNVTDEEKALLLQLPLDSAARAAAHRQIAEAYLKSAMLYLESLNSPQRAVQQLDSLLKRYPHSSLAPAALFYLIKAYEATGDAARAAHYRAELKRRFPSSVYVQLLNRKLLSRIQQARTKAERQYTEVLTAYEEGRCHDVLGLSAAIDTHYLLPNTQTALALMTLVCRSRGLPTDTMLARLTAFVRAHSGRQATRMAQRLIQAYQHRKLSEIQARQDSIKRADLKKYPYEISFKGPFFYILALPSDALPLSDAAQHLSNVNLIMYAGKKSLRITPIAFSADTSLLIVKPFFTHAEVDDYYRRISKQQRFFSKLKLKNPLHFYITQSNFKRLLAENNLTEYAAFFRQTYLEEEETLRTTP